MSRDWTDEDQAAAEMQGWNGFEKEDGGFTIGAEQDVPVFADDAEASAYVWHCADRGAQLAIQNGPASKLGGFGLVDADLNRRSERVDAEIGAEIASHRGIRHERVVAQVQPDKHLGLRQSLAKPLQEIAQVRRRAGNFEIGDADHGNAREIERVDVAAGDGLVSLDARA